MIKLIADWTLAASVQLDINHYSERIENVRTSNIKAIVDNKQVVHRTR